MKLCNLIGQLQGSISHIFMSVGGRALSTCEVIFSKKQCGTGKVELDWEELESLDTRTASHCTAASVPGVVGHSNI